MLDRHLTTFIITAECGSFLAAAEKLYVSGNAVSKQIRLLESDLGIQLFERSTRGLALTPAGKLIYEEAKKLTRRVERVLTQARELEQGQERAIRVGTSLISSADILLSHWGRAAAEDIQLQIVPYVDTNMGFSSMLERMGSEVDCIAGLYENNYWANRYQTFHLTDLPCRIACSHAHPLTRKPLLSIGDLRRRTILVGRGRNSGPSTDAICTYLEQFGDIQLEYRDYVEYTLFNELVGSDKLMLTFDCWRSVHPLVSTLPVDWDFCAPYGLMYANPSENMKRFLEVLGAL